MSKLRQLIEAANRKCEMAWKVYSYNPEKDNELVDTSKAFDCIAAAQAHKREILEKNPNYTVEIIAESVRVKTTFGSGKKGVDTTYREDKDAVDAIKNALIDGSKGTKVIATVESAQKNEAKTIDDIRTADIAKYLKDNKKTDLKALKLKSKAFAKDLQNYFKLTSEPSVFDIDKVLDALPYFMQEAANIDVKNPGVLEVPDGKKVNELPQSHFEKLVDKKGYAEVIRALTNLEVWNKDKNKSLSSWASSMADKLKKKFRSESNEKEDKIKKAKKELDDLYYQMARAGAAGIEPPQSMFDRKNELIKFLKANESAQKSESKVNMSKLKNEVQAAVNKYFKDDKDLLEYVHIDTKKDKLGRDILEVRAELGYNDMVKLADYLDRIVTKYDKYAYFDQETSGIMTAVFESIQKDLANHLLQVLSKGGATLKQLQDFESKGYSNKDLLDTLKDLIQQKKIKTSLEGGTLRYILTESAQKNESLRDLNLELADDTNAIAASADKIRQRFEYRTLQNQSYDEKQAEKIYLEVRRELEKAKKLIDACYNKIG